MKNTKKRQQLLMQELKAYEKVTPMTDDERKALHEWVKAGNSVHENPGMAHYENGRPMDFLDIYREEEELRNATASMTDEEIKEFLHREYGIDVEPKPEPKPKPTYDELLAKANRLFRICLLYRDVLFSNDLLDEAHEHIQEYIDAEPLFDLFEFDFER